MYKIIFGLSCLLTALSLAYNYNVELNLLSTILIGILTLRNK